VIDNADIPIRPIDDGGRPRAECGGPPLICGRGFPWLDVKNTNINTLKTGDVTSTNLNANENKHINHQSQSLGLIPLRREVVPIR
jgi:hypothetical protein